MQLEHDFLVPAPIDRAWAALLDIERVAPCMPGATLESIDGDDFTGKVKVKVGPIQVTYAGKARFAEKNEETHSAVIEASGREARGSGTAQATIRANLAEDGESTRVRVTTDLAITGKPAQFGRGVLNDVGAKILGIFAECLAGQLGAPAESPEPPAAAGSEGTGSGGAGSEGAGSAAESVGAESVGAESGGAESGGAESGGAGSAGTTEAPEPALPDRPGGNGSGPSVAATAAAADSGVWAAATEPVAAPTAAPSGPRKVEQPATRPTPDAIDLLDTAGAPLAKRLIPLVAGIVALLLVLRLLRRRRRQ